MSSPVFVATWPASTSWSMTCKTSRSKLTPEKPSSTKKRVFKKMMLVCVPLEDDLLILDASGHAGLQVLLAQTAI